MTILTHTSKTMRSPSDTPLQCSKPALLDKTSQLAAYLKTLSVVQIAECMKVSAPLAQKTYTQITAWTDDASGRRPAAESFIGDIFSGLQAGGWTPKDWEYAQQQLRILSGLYGILSPKDGVAPYRLEMGYKLPDEPYRNLYQFWGEAIADKLPDSGAIVNLAAVEYAKTVTPYVNNERLITPSFYTISPKTNQPVFVVVHAKIARGAFASWMIKEQIENPERLREFSDLGYRYSLTLSTPSMPVFICNEFKGLGLSVRLKNV